MQNNIELDLKYSLKQSAKYLLDDVELKTGQFFDLISEKNDLELSTGLSDKEGNISKEEQKAEEKKAHESLLSVGRKQKRTTLIDLRRHFKTKRIRPADGIIFVVKSLRAWKRYIDNKMSLANKFFILKFAPRVLKLWRKHIFYYQTTKKSPKRGYLEIYLKNKSSNGVSGLLDDTPLSQGSLKRAGKKELTKLNNKKKKEMIGRKFKKRNDMYHHSYGSEDDNFRQQKQSTRTLRQTLV